MNTSLAIKSTLAGLLAVCLLNSTALAADKGLKPGDIMPDLKTFQLEGKLPPSLQGKVVILDFWASWCGPCKDSFPIMEELQTKYSGKGLVVLAVNLDDEKSTMDDFLKKHPVTFTVVRDASKKLVAHASIKSMPTSFVIAPDGKIVSVHKGFHGSTTQAQYVQEIDSLIGHAVASKE